MNPSPLPSNSSDNCPVCDGVGLDLLYNEWEVEWEECSNCAGTGLNDENAEDGEEVEEYYADYYANND